MRIYVLSLALALSACITPVNNLDLSDNSPRQKNAAISQPTSDKLANFTRNRPVPKTPDQKGASFKPISTSDIIGQNKNTLLQVLGRPSFKRSDHPAEIWRYQDEACLLDLYLYRPLNTGAEKAPLVTFIEARMPRGPRAETLSCLNIIRRRFVENALS